MTLYFFDLRHDEGFVLDDEGLELPDFPAVQTESPRPWPARPRKRF